MAPTTLAIRASGALLVYQGYITYRVARNPGLTRGQKIGQCMLVWLLPLIGAAVVQIMLGLDMEVRPVDRNFTPQAPNDGGGAI